MPVESMDFRQVVGQCGDDCGFALAALLVMAAEPVPAFAGILALRLRGIRDHVAMLLCERVHARAAREVLGSLGAAMQHHDERRRIAEAAWNEELVMHFTCVAREELIEKRRVRRFVAVSCGRLHRPNGLPGITPSIGNHSVLTFDAARGRSRRKRLRGGVRGLVAPVQAALNRCRGSA
ncbi:hypothetical protein D3C83_01600 [compost metagenome]